MSVELQQQVTILNAQLNAHKQIINELMEASVNLRTNLDLHQSANKELLELKNKKDAENAELKSEIEPLKQELARIKGLQVEEVLEAA